MCTFLLQNGALWDNGLMPCGICEIGLLNNCPSVSETLICMDNAGLRDIACITYPFQYGYIRCESLCRSYCNIFINCGMSGNHKEPTAEEIATTRTRFLALTICGIVRLAKPVSGLAVWLIRSTKWDVITHPYLNTLGPRQNGRHFADKML